AEREAFEANLGANFNAGQAVNGLVADGSARAALTWALGQRGKPYVWGAEGPDAFDCSGLVLAAYQSVHYTLPRLAVDQYHFLAGLGHVEPVSMLLPGDLLFFATNRSDWTTVHHVAIYLGNNQMLHAPTTGDVVKVSTVWWSEFFAAAYVFPHRGAQ